MTSSAASGYRERLEFELGEARRRMEAPDPEVSVGLRLAAVETVLAAVDGKRHASGASVWSLTGVDPAPYRETRGRLSASLSQYAPQEGLPLAVAAEILDRLSPAGTTTGTAGAFFTPPDLARFMATQLFVPGERWAEVRDMSVLDPACGAGALLLAAVNQASDLVAQGGPRARGQLERWTRDHVRGVDRDPVAVIAAAHLLARATGTEAERLLELGALRVADSLCCPEEAFGSRRYDRIILNPPWLKAKQISDKRYAAKLRADERYPLTTEDGRGDVDLYQFFLELSYSLATDTGRISFIVPGTFLRSTRAARLRHLYLTGGRLTRLDEFWNQQRLFPIHSMFRFVTGTLDKGKRPGSVAARFRLTTVAETVTQRPQTLPHQLLVDRRRGVARAVPEIRSRAAKDVLSKLTRQHPRMGDPSNPWSEVRFRRELDMTNDRPLFTTSNEVAEGVPYLPVYEGRMVHQFDAAAKTYGSGCGRSAEWTVWSPEIGHRAQFYVRRDRLRGEQLRRVDQPRAGFCDVTGHANERTVLASIIPGGSICGNKVPTLDAADSRLHLIWTALANSFIVDWHVRRTVTTTLNYHYLLETPFPWVDPDSRVGRDLARLSTLLSGENSRDGSILRARSRARARIDAIVAALFGLSPSDLEEVLDDFPLLDRGQPGLDGQPSTITRDLVISTYSRTIGERSALNERRVRAAEAQGAIAYVPGEVSAMLNARS